MLTAPPSSQTTLVVLLGASKWPYSLDFQASKAFLNSAVEMREYFLNPSKFALPQENLLNLFDSNQSSDDIDREIEQFLDQRISRMKEVGLAARDLVVYFVGHGGFAGGDAEYYLAIRRTRAANPMASSIGIVSLAHTLKEKARYLRRIIILDCCFAASAFIAFQASPTQAAITQTLDAFKIQRKGGGIPGRGTSLLCSSRHNRPSLLLPDGSATMFSQALLEALATGNPHLKHPLSLQDVASLTEDVLRTMATGNAPRPEVHSPDQSEGDIAQLPFFPNPPARATGDSANVKTSLLAEKPLQPIIHGPPFQERPGPSSMEAQQQSYPNNARPGSFPPNATSAPNQSQQLSNLSNVPRRSQVVSQEKGTASFFSHQNNKAGRDTVSSGRSKRLYKNEHKISNLHQLVWPYLQNRKIGWLLPFLYAMMTIFLLGILASLALVLTHTALPTPEAQRSSVSHVQSSPTLQRGIQLLGCPDVEANTLQMVADGQTVYAAEVQAKDKTGNQGNTCPDTAMEKPVVVDGITCKIWLTKAQDFSGDLSSDSSQLQHVDQLNNPSPNEIPSGLIFDPNTPQVQPCKQGQEYWKFTISPTVSSGDYFIVGLTDLQGIHYNWSWYQVKIRNN